MKSFTVFVSLCVGNPIPFWHHSRVLARNAVDATSKAFEEINLRYGHSTYRVHGVAVATPDSKVAPLTRAIAAT